MAESPTTGEILVEVVEDEVAMLRRQESRGDRAQPRRRRMTHSDSSFGLRPRVIRAQVS